MKLIQHRFVPMIHSFNDSLYGFIDGPVYRITRDSFTTPFVASLRNLKREDDRKSDT
jgi:hypothetical protein